MNKKYYYKNIVYKKSWGTYDAYYTYNGRTFTLCVGATTKASAEEIAKHCIDYLNRKEK